MIKIEHVSKTFNHEIKAIDDVNLEINAKDKYKTQNKKWIFLKDS